jgi:putative ABC transport system permease protein
MIRDIFEMSLKSLTRQQIRSFLTLAGVVIGIAAIVCLLSIGAGLTLSVNEQFEKMGTNIVYLLGSNPLSGSSQATEFSDSDIAWIESVSGVDYALPLYMSSGTMEANGEKQNIVIMSADIKKAEVFEKFGYFDVEEGRTIESEDSQGILVSKKLAQEIFEKPLTAKKIVYINGEQYKIAGVQKPLQQVVGDQDPSNMVMMTLTAFDRIVPNKKPVYVMVITLSREDNTQISEKLTDHFENKYGEKAVYVYTSDQVLEQVNSLYAIITFFLIGISAIAMIVGGVGIMNAMVTSVIEKTKEIGIMKALGASNFIILMIFIIEAALIGLIGGAIGTLLGYGLSQIIALFAIQSGFILQGVINVEITLVGLGFSTIVGIISGFIPAWNAANLDPIEALRFE